MRTIVRPAALYWSTSWWMYMEPGEKSWSEREGGRRVRKTKNEVWVSHSFHYCKLNHSLSFKRKTHIKTIDMTIMYEVKKSFCMLMSISVWQLKYFRGCALSSHARSGVNRAIHARMSCEMPLTHQMSPECQQFHVLCVELLFCAFILVDTSVLCISHAPLVLSARLRHLCLHRDLCFF